MATEEKYFELFLDLSVVLTGHTSYALLGTGMAKLYFTTLMEIPGEDITAELLDTFATVVSDTDGSENTTDLLLRNRILSDPKFGPLARNLIKLWYVGSWYELPEAWRTAYGINEHDVTFVVSTTSYKEGLLWPTIGAHPPGAKAHGYGSWNAPPNIPQV